MPSSKPSVFILGDCHFPEANQKALKWSYGLIRQLKPDYVVQIGDLYDNFNLSKYAKSLDYMTPVEEMALARKQADEMWRQVKKAAPKTKCVQILGNHDTRGMKRMLEKAPEMEGLVDWKAVFTFPGVKTYLDEKEEVIIGGIIFTHGYKRMGEHARFNQCSTVHGHTHHAGVQYFQNLNGVYWELDVGFLGDVDSSVFTYRNQRKLHGWTVGCGWVDENGPRFLSYPGK